jgi:hypothetical protein
VFHRAIIVFSVVMEGTYVGSLRSCVMKRKGKRAGEVRLEPAPAVTPKQFVKAWQESESVAEVAKKVGRSKNACRVRAFRYREFYGVPLKFYPAVEIEEVDWVEVAEFAESLEARQEGPEAPVEAMG